MRTFLLCNLSGQWEVNVEVLGYDTETKQMLVKTSKRHGCIQYARFFDPATKYNRSDYRVVKVNDVGELNAKLAELRARHQAGEAHGEEAR
jgi:hypothetical protein